MNQNSNETNENSIPNVNIKTSKERNVPDLRFSEYTYSWKKEKLGNHIEESKQLTSDFEKYPLYSFTIESGVTPKTERYERGFLVKKDGDLFKVIKKNEFIMNPMNLRFGAINYSNIERAVSVSGYYDIFILYEGKYNDFWNYYLKTPKTLAKYNSIATGSLSEKKRVHFSQLKEMKFYIPNDIEMSRINDFLRLIDNRIETQKKIISKIESQIKAIKSQIFNSNIGTKKSLVDILDEVSIKSSVNNQYPVISSTVKGLVLQSEYFEKEIASADNTGYKIITKNNIIISPQNLWMGNITFNDKFENGIVSPSYKIFNIKEGYNKLYIFELMTTKKSFYLYKTVSEQGASVVRRNLNFEAFMQLTYNIPSVEEQNKTIENLYLLKNKYENEKKILSLYEKQKQYLLNKMFI